MTCPASYCWLALSEPVQPGAQLCAAAGSNTPKRLQACSPSQANTLLFHGLLTARCRKPKHVELGMGGTDF